MPRTNAEFAQETKRWKNYISNINTVPLDQNHSYKSTDDPYERLMQFVKSWVEGEFGLFTNREGKLESLEENQRTKESMDAAEAYGFHMTYPSDKWYDAALSGKKALKAELPHFSGHADIMHEYIGDLREQAKSMLLPAYRALHESFNKRPFWQWFTKHAEYTAERDALKVLGNVLKSAMHFKDKELKALLKENQAEIPDNEVMNAEVGHVKMYEPSKQIEPNEKKINLQELINDKDNPNAYLEALEKIHQIEDQKELDKQNEKEERRNQALSNKKEEDIKSIDEQNDIVKNNNEQDNIGLEEIKMDESSLQSKNGYTFPGTHKEIDMMMLFDPNYAPNPDNIGKEYTLAQMWFKTMRTLKDFEGGYIKLNGEQKTNFSKFSKILGKCPGAKEVFDRNYERISDAWKQDPEDLDKYLWGKVDRYTAEKNDLLEQNPNYKIPEYVDNLMSTKGFNKTAERNVRHKANERRQAEERSRQTEEQRLKEYVRDVLLERNPELKKDPVQLKKLVEETYTKEMIREGISDSYSEEQAEKMINEEYARIEAEKEKERSAQENLDLSELFVESDDGPKSEKIDPVEIQAPNKELNI